MKIGFNANGFSYRGVEIAVFDYALHNEKLLQNESVIFYKSSSKSEFEVFEKFKKNFNVIPYEDITHLEKLVRQNKLDLMYFIKSGERDGNIVTTIPAAIHAVFPTHSKEFHGDKFAFVSEWLAKEYSNKKIPYVPHMIDLPQIEGNLRKDLAIPNSATVLGCYGGQDSFNLRFVHETILKVLDKRKDLYFLFMNITPFAKNERLIFLPGSADISHKIRFINTVDGMIHARGIGESFGLACGEFSIKNKPVMTYALSPQRSHIEILGNKALLYRGTKDLEELLYSFNPQVQYQTSWDAYSERFSPVPVMEKFKSVFLCHHQRSIAISPLDRGVVQAYRLKRKLRNLTKKIYL